jgi:hypothetical protein
MAQTTGTPTLNPPPPGDPQSLADGPQSVDRYDCVIGGTGFMLYRDQDDTHPSETYSPQPVDLTYTPVFIERQNVQGDLGDNTQDFYMTFVQRDWSGGIGQKYFRQQQDRDRSFWDGSIIKPTVVPGAVTIGPREQTSALVNGTNFFCQMLYVKETSSATTTQGDCMVKVEGTSANTIKVYGSRDGGVTWQVQPNTSASPWTDCCDAVAGDDGRLYFLESGVGGAGTSIVHSIPGLTLGMPNTIPATITWTNWTALTFIAHAIEYYNGSVYAAGNDGTVRLITSGGGGGTVIKDLGGGRAIDMLTAGGFLWILYISAQGDYRLYQYDGSTVSEAARLPRGWKMQYNTETPLRHFDCLDTNLTFTHSRQVNCMCYQDGVVYVSGMTPSRDYAMSQRGACPFRTALWYYAAGNTGLIWEADVTAQHYYWGGGSACCPIQGGMIAFADVLNNKLMCYDPNTGGVFPLSTITNPTSGTASLGVQLASGTSTTSLVTTVHVADFTGMPTPGTVLQRTAGGTVQELMLVVSEAGIGPADLTLVRGYNGTTPDDASLATMTTGTSKTCTFTLPVTPIYRLEYDWQNHVLHAVWYKDDTDKINGGAGVFSAMQNQHTFWQLREAKSADAGVVTTSNFDFNSSLQKYFRSVAVDFEQDQMNRTDSRNGTVDIYYKIDGVVSTTTDNGVHLVKSNAVSGTPYDILVQGTNIQIIVQLNSGATSSTMPQSLGPALKRISVKGAPIMPGYRMRKYVIALFDNLRLKDGGQEQGTPASLRKTLETLIQSNTPISVSDAAMSGVTMVFEPDQCKVREVRPGEYLCYVVMREV